MILYKTCTYLDLRQRIVSLVSNTNTKVQGKGVKPFYDIPGLFNEIYQKYDPNEWRLLIDSLKYIFKGVLLHNANKNI